MFHTSVRVPRKAPVPMDGPVPQVVDLVGAPLREGNPMIYVVPLFDHAQLERRAPGAHTLSPAGTVAGALLTT